MQSALHAVHDGIEQLNSNVHAETNRAADALKQHTEMLNGHVAAGVEGMQNHVSKVANLKISFPVSFRGSACSA